MPRDTVSSIGVVRGTHMLPGTIDGMKHVCYFRHALALDERRVKFLPEYAYGGKTTHGKNATTDAPSAVKLPDKEHPPSDNIPVSPIKKKAGGIPKAKKKDIVKHEHTLEVWFAGTHSD